MNWDNVGTFLRMASNEFQTHDAMKLKECCPNDLRLRFGILSSFPLEDRRERDGSQAQRDEDRYGVVRVSNVSLLFQLVGD